jgi:hypothetical protein
MSDLTPEQVRTLAAAVGLSIGDDDLDDVTVRLNASLRQLRMLETLPAPPGPPPSSRGGSTAPFLGG